jgi:DHA1 family bicyclomycin/chloramphenicol resistance-like MFS transporter
MLRPGTFALTALLALLTALGPLSMDMYLPSLPDIGRLLNASTASVQLTISSYLIGFAVGQFFYGPISDRYGRKPVLLAALAIYVAATLICATTQSIETLTAMRFLQALGGSGSIVLARAMVRDLYSGVHAGRELSRMGSITAFAPIVAPAIGGVLQTAFGWRASFIVLACFGVLAGVVAARLLPETLRHPMTGPVSLAAMGRLYRSVLEHRGFLAHLGILTSSFVGLLAWVSGASVVLQGVYGLSPFVFGVTYAVGAAGYMLGTHMAARLVTPFGLDRTMGFGAAALAAGGLSMAAVVALGLDDAAWLVAAMSLYLVGLGLAMPQAMAGALTPFADRAGTASSLMGFTQQSSAAIAAAIIGHYLGTSAWPVAGVVAAMGCSALLIWALTRGVRRRQDLIAGNN